MKPRTNTTQFRADAYRFRVQMFLAALPMARRAAIAARPRFYRIPWVRRAGELPSTFDHESDEADTIPGLAPALKLTRLLEVVHQ